jgi:hypothetical protein
MYLYAYWTVALSKEIQQRLYYHECGVIHGACLKGITILTMS